MEIDYTISFKDALQLAVQLIQGNEALNKEFSESLVSVKQKNGIDIHYQAAFNACYLANEICKEIKRLEKAEQD